VDNSPDYSRLLSRSLLALVIGAGLVVCCYFFVDRPMAWFVYDNGIDRSAELAWLTYPPPWLERFAPLAVTALMVRRAWGPFHRWERVLLASCISLMVTVQFKDTLKFAFGRFWPETWINNNPSLIRDNAYGFHPFHDGPGYGSFPSGHTARAVAVAAVVWIAYPGWRWACVLATVAVVVGLVGKNYHFVGDTIAGGFVGGIVGGYTARIFALTPTDRSSGDKSRSI
jgi:membrane-associated phospholipid phosphatase